MTALEVRGRFFNSTVFPSLWAPISATETGAAGAHYNGGAAAPVAELAGALFLYRSSDGLGKWIVTDRERDFVDNTGCVPVLCERFKCI